jgi:hypothetical protein
MATLTTSRATQAPIECTGAMYDATVATTVVTLIKLEGDRSNSRGDADKNERAAALSIALTTRL